MSPSKSKPKSAQAPASVSRRDLNQRALQETSLHCFIEVVNTGSITEAASRLDVAPSAVSRQIARLERELDTLLFERRARGMTPTSAGELLAIHVRRSWLDIERVSDEIRALRGLRMGQVRIAATEGFAFEFLPTLIASFQSQRPGIEFSIQQVPQSEIARLVREGEVDLGITVSLSAERGIVVELRHPSPVLAVMATDHPLSKRRHITLAQALSYPLALPAPNATLRLLLDISCGRQGLTYQNSFTCDHLYPLVNYAAKTQAITFCGETALQQHLQTGLITAKPLLDREMNERYFEVQTLAGRQLPDAARAFIQHLRAHINHEI